MTSEHERRVVEVCAAWGRGPVVAVEPVVTPGFSGSPVHVVTLAAARRFVVKPFAPHVTRERADWIHGLMRHARAGGMAEVPEVLVAVGGGSIVGDRDGRLWELVQWMDGRPDAAPTAARAAAALGTLARLHAAWGSFPGATAAPGVSPGPGASPGVERRVQQATDLLHRPWSIRFGAGGARSEADELAPIADLCHAAAGMLDGARGRRCLMAVATARVGAVRRQAVVRDLWSDHVLFTDREPARVAGIVDFHAAGIDTPLTDIARLLGSWPRPGGGAEGAAGGLTGGWCEPLAAYGEARGQPLTTAEAWLCDWLHAAGVICGLDNWFRWTLEENRRFPDAHRAIERMQRLVADLPAAIDWLASAGNQPV
ncbi:MAG: phosphotransferase [Planctomycetaceae bacterium]